MYAPKSPPTYGQPPPPPSQHTNPPPMATGYPAQQPVDGPWSSGLCGCFDDCGNCFLTCCCPCITFGQIAEIVDQGTTSCGVHGALYGLIMWLTGCGCLYSCVYRSRLRAEYRLKESPCNDCCVHFFCESCALCQEYRELKNRGFNMSLGWHGNMERRNRGVEMAPPTAPVMEKG